MKRIIFFIMLTAATSSAVAGQEVDRDYGMTDKGEVIVQESWAFLPFVGVEGGGFDLSVDYYLRPGVNETGGTDTVAGDKIDPFSIGPVFGITAVTGENMFSLYGRLSFSSSTDLSLAGVKYNKVDSIWSVAVEKFGADITYDDNYGEARLDTWRLKVGVDLAPTRMPVLMSVGLLATYNDIEVNALDSTGDFRNPVRRVVGEDTKLGGGFYLELKHKLTFTESWRGSIGYGAEMGGTSEPESEGDLGMTYLHLFARASLVYVF